MKAGSGYALNASAVSTAPAGRARAAHSTSLQLGGHEILSVAPTGDPDPEHLSPSNSPRGVQSGRFSASTCSARTGSLINRVAETPISISKAMKP